MGRRIKFQMGYGSHLPVLLKAVSLTTGPVLELGMGIFSTPVLHWICSSQHRPLISYENTPEIYAQMEQFRDEYHQVSFVENWDLADLSGEWDVVLIDHHPAERRIVDIRRLANCTKYIVCHDTYWKQDRYYHYKEIFPLFRYRYDYTVYRPGYTSILSNLIDLKDFKV